MSSDLHAGAVRRLHFPISAVVFQAACEQGACDHLEGECPKAKVKVCAHCWGLVTDRANGDYVTGEAAAAALFPCPTRRALEES